MNVVGKVGSLISRGVYSVATPFQPYGGAVDIIVVKQQDGTFRSAPWRVRFGKFQGNLTDDERIVSIFVNGVKTNFYMYLENSGDAYFVRECTSAEEIETNGDVKGLENAQRLSRLAHSVSDSGVDKTRDECGFPGSGRMVKAESDVNYRYCGLQDKPNGLPQGSESEMVLMSVDGHVLTAPISGSEQIDENVQLSSPRFHLGPAEGPDICEQNGEFGLDENAWASDYIDKLNASTVSATSDNVCSTKGNDDAVDNSARIVGEDVSSSCLEPPELEEKIENANFKETDSVSGSQSSSMKPSHSDTQLDEVEDQDIVEEKNWMLAQQSSLVHPEAEINQTLHEASDVKHMHPENDSLSNGSEAKVEPTDAIPVKKDNTVTSAGDSLELRNDLSGRRWRLWPIAFRSVNNLQQNSSSPREGSSNDSVSSLQKSEKQSNASTHKQVIKTNVPTSEQIASLNLQDGQNMVSFSFSTAASGTQQIDAHIYLWKWNARIVISDVDGTITRSDVLGQFMPLVGKDWSQIGVAKFFSSIKENGYQLLFLSARAIVQAYMTRSFLFNLKQDGSTLPSGPVVISPDGLFPSFYREVIRRAPHEFKIACLEDIKKLFPPDYNPFYAGFGNRETDEISYRRMGIPKGKIFIINPKGEVAISHRLDVKSYTSLHTLVNEMFPPTPSDEPEDFNSWNFWKMPLPDI